MMVRLLAIAAPCPLEIEYNHVGQSVLGTNSHQDILDNSLSSFEGFTAADILNTELDLAGDMSVSSPSSSSDSCSGLENDETSLDSVDWTMSNSPKQFNLALNIEKMWITDATTKKCEVTMITMSRKKIYELSNLPPNWDEIDPYSLLEELNTSSPTELNCVQESDSDATIIMMEFLSEKENRYPTRTLRKNTMVRWSSRTKTVTNYQESSCSSSEDSDYNPR